MKWYKEEHAMNNTNNQDSNQVPILPPPAIKPAPVGCPFLPTKLYGYNEVSQPIN